MNDCIFCKIVKGEIESVKIWENSEFLAILDVNPNVEGMTLLLTKDHYDSYVFDIGDETYKRYFVAAKKVVRILERGLKVKRVALVMEGLGVDHAHLKLYPLHGLDKKFSETWAKGRVYFERYGGYISTQLGPKRDHEYLQRVAKKILKGN